MEDGLRFAAYGRCEGLEENQQQQWHSCHHGWRDRRVLLAHGEHHHLRDSTGERTVTLAQTALCGIGMIRPLLATPTEPNWFDQGAMRLLACGCAWSSRLVDVTTYTD